MLGTFSPQQQPYTFEMEEETTPSGMFARGSYYARTKVINVDPRKTNPISALQRERNLHWFLALLFLSQFVDDDGKCYLDASYCFEIQKSWPKSFWSSIWYLIGIGLEVLQAVTLERDSSSGLLYLYYYKWQSDNPFLFQFNCTTVHGMLHDHHLLQYDSVPWCLKFSWYFLEWVGMGWKWIPSEKKNGIQ
jgi:hypothetical protein